MKEISSKNLIQLMGGAAQGQCDYLQEMAAEHEPLESKEAEDAWWDSWGEAFERCALS